MVNRGGWSKCPIAKASESKRLPHESMHPLQKSKRLRGPGPQLPAVSDCDPDMHRHTH